MNFQTILGFIGTVLPLTFIIATVIVRGKKLFN